MNNIGQTYFDIGRMDTLARVDSVLHRLDPRAKLITTLCFILAVVSFDKYAISALTPFFLYPMILIVLGRLPVGYILKKVLIASPFAVLIGIFNPLIDTAILVRLGPVAISGGWISFISILLRFVLTVSAALSLVALTGFNAVCQALIKLGVPRYFALQLLFFYRYVFVLSDEVERMIRARALRSFRSSAMGLSLFTAFAGQLLMRALDRAERIYMAMCCRGFDGHIRMIKAMSIRQVDIFFILFWLTIFIFLRCINVPLWLGGVLIGAW